MASRPPQEERRVGMAKIYGRIMVALAVAWALLSPPGSGRVAAAETNSRPLRIGLANSLFRGMSPALVQVLSKPLQALMESQTGLSGQMSGSADAISLGKMLHERQVEVGIFHGFEFAWVQQQYPDLKPLLLAYSNPELQAFLIV